MVAGGLGLFYLLRCSFKASSDVHLRQDNSSRLVRAGAARCVGGVVCGCACERVPGDAVARLVLRRLT